MLLNPSRNLKIADFGVARVEAMNPSDMTGETGTLGYMAPEVLAFSRMISIFTYIFKLLALHATVSSSEHNHFRLSALIIGLHKCRFWMGSLTTGDVMSIALAFACGKFTAVICLIQI